ncbi:PREDICTED: BAG family molecular chaperone regulator 1-like isoform X2 [Priapulus caudatus]|uniref:BAG family molecular chaperone regulator 1 n=1 Tax=Priapulus caudatus TaxID=37621 RepID=A0ABM1E7D1_PRICU|nr:PREDICTED: BAG family molecular chaperone regulator 1-like isoform X2 [Priapulus caudatus]
MLAESNGQRTHVNGGAKKHVIELDLASSVEDFAALVERATDVPVASQKLIFKGKTLQSVNTLEASGVCDGSKIMLIGRKHAAEEEMQMKEVEKVEKEVDVAEKQLLELGKEIDGIEKGWLEGMQKREALGKLSKRAAVATEQFMRRLVKLDALEIGAEHKSARLRRKSLVVRLQKLLQKCDQGEERLQRLLSNDGSS